MKRGKGKIKKKTLKKTTKPVSHKNSTLAVIAALLMFFFLLGFVNVTNETNVTITGHSVIEDMFTDWNAGNIDANIIKYLFLITLTLFIFGALNAAGFPENSFIQFFIALIVSFLGIAFITPNELFAVLTGYTALALTLTVIFPFIIFLFVSAMLLSNEKIKSMTVGKILAEIVLWVSYVAFLGYKLIVGYSGIDRSNWVLVIMWGILFLSIGILIFNKHFRSKVREYGLEIKSARAEGERGAAERARLAGVEEDEFSGGGGI